MEVPFPEPQGFYQVGELENLLFQDQFINYESLPETLSSIPIDKYATWLAQLTKADSMHRERGSFLFIDADNMSKWTFPANPVIGNENSVVSMMTKRPSKHFPVARFHSHPDSTAPSGADVSRMIMDEGLFFEGDNDALLEVVGAQGVNYLMLRTRDSQHLSKKQVDGTINEYQAIVDAAVLQMAQFFRDLAVDSGVTDDMIPGLYKKLREEEEQLFGSDFPRYIQTINVVNALCEQQKFGFYHSQQDGIFRQVTREDIGAIRDLEGELVRSVVDGSLL